ncbi:MAG: type II toxin-antitoxin system death-on-curing family toxin [Planctomycetes bacterium]|nr:type II toxin-antitoxin system death-on-curing family toxin [Planctomycetota bacterium]
MSIDFLSVEDLQRIHMDQVERYGGSTGIRDQGLLESAAAMPQSGFGGQYFHSDVFEMAAAYLYHLAKNHAFIDGNKRVAAVASLMFLRLNGVETELTNEELVDTVLGVAEGRVAKSAVAEFFRKHGRARR